MKCEKCNDMGFYFISNICEEPVKIECDHKENEDKKLTIIYKDDQ